MGEWHSDGDFSFLTSWFNVRGGVGAHLTVLPITPCFPLLDPRGVEKYDLFCG